MNYEKSSSILNLARSMELQAISQYMTQHYMLDDRDFNVLALSMKVIAVQEMRHAEMLALRIRELRDIPTNVQSGPADSSSELEYVYPADVALETETTDLYASYVKELEDAMDYASAQLLKKILVEEEAHRQYFLSIMEHIDKFGADFLAGQVSASFKPNELI